MGAEKVIAVMGVTGAGKSSFIKLVTGDESIKVGETLVSETYIVSSYKFRHKDRTIVLVDTPGFDDTQQKDSDVLKILADWFESTYRSGIKLSGIIYLHRITDDRMRGSSMRSMRMFRKLCGESFYRNLLLGTTCWSLIPEDLGTQRETELMTDQNFWKGFIAKGAQFVRIPDDGFDAKELVYDLARLEPAALQIQNEMVDQHIQFKALSATQMLDNGLSKIKAEQKEEKRRLELENQRQAEEQNKMEQELRCQLGEERRTNLLGFRLAAEHAMIVESKTKFIDGLKTDIYLAKLHALSIAFATTCDGCCKWVGTTLYYVCSKCPGGSFTLCSDCHGSGTMFCYEQSHHASMKLETAGDAPPKCRYSTSAIAPEAHFACYRCGSNLEGVFVHCCVCLNDNFNMCLECLINLGTCKKSWSLSGHRLHPLVRRTKRQPVGVEQVNTSSSQHESTRENAQNISGVQQQLEEYTKAFTVKIDGKIMCSVAAGRDEVVKTLPPESPVRTAPKMISPTPTVSRKPINTPPKLIASDEPLVHEEPKSPKGETPVVVTAITSEPSGSLKSSFSGSEAGNSSLPPGWELRLTEEGRLYYVNHFMRTTSWDRPAPVATISNFPPSYEVVDEQEPLSLSSEPGTHPIDITSGAHFLSDFSPYSPNAESAFPTVEPDQAADLILPDQDSEYHKDCSKPCIQKTRGVSNIQLYKGKSKAIWAADMPIALDLFEKLTHHQHESGNIRYTALTGDPDDLLRIDYDLRPYGPIELLIGVDMKNVSYDREKFNNALVTTLGSLMDELSTQPFSKDFTARCNGSPWTGIIVCINLQFDREKDVSWLRQMGIGFVWDLPPVHISGIKGSKQLVEADYDDGHKHPRKIFGNKVQTILHEYTTTFRIKNWRENPSAIPDIIPGSDPIQIILCLNERGTWLEHSAPNWYRPIGKLLDARMCIHVKGGKVISPCSIQKMWQLSKHELKPSESGKDITIEEYIG